MPSITVQSYPSQIGGPAPSSQNIVSCQDAWHVLFKLPHF